jgi:acetamidase/formamidase
MATHRLDADERTLHGTFSRDREPVLVVDPGDTVVFTTLDAGWSVSPWAGGPDASWARHPAWREGFGHALTGPVHVRGAEPGDTLEIRVLDVVPGSYGTTFGGGRPSPYNERYGLVSERAVLSWTLDAPGGVGTNQLGHAVRLAPFMGVMGTPPPEPGEHSTIPPRVWGGNLDCRELVAGSTLYLPIGVPGALFSTGDGHARQGDGEVGGTAIECPMSRVSLSFAVRRDFPVTGPVARGADGSWVTLGLGDTLDDATFEALDVMFTLLQREFGITRPEAAALASVTVDVRVTQIVNEVVGAHAVLAPNAITRPTS